MDNVLVSVIVPVYNSEKYLEECIDSIVNQTLRNIEIIFVDDGSTDSSLTILEQYQKNDDRIRIIRQKNQFAGVARNNGLKAATGKYVIFLDSDDFFELNMLEKTTNLAETFQVELVHFDYWYYDSETKHRVPRRRKYNLPQKVFSAKELTAEELGGGDPCPWNKLLLRSYVLSTGLRYQELSSCNDDYFNKMIFFLAERIISVSECFVNYRTNNENSTQGKVRKATAVGLENTLKCQLSIKQEMMDRNIFIGEYQKYYYQRATWIISSCLSETKNSIQNMRLGYDLVKRKIVPEIFPSSDCFSSSGLLLNVKCSNSFEEFLYLEMCRDEKQIELMRNSMVSKDTMDYKIGCTILRIPRWIKNIYTRIGLKQWKETN